jgi:2'-5' RNA ligase
VGAREERVPKVRVFAAVDVPGSVSTLVLAATAPLRRRHPSPRWTQPEGWHLTLAFLGWVDEGEVPAVRGALARAAAATEPFELRLTGAAGSFRSGVVWAGLEESPALQRLAAAAREELVQVVALPDADRPFRPHLTLARTKGRPGEARAAAEAYDGPAAAWRVEECVLMRSHLSKSGARYEQLDAWLLGVAAPDA